MQHLAANINTAPPDIVYPLVETLGLFLDDMLLNHHSRLCGRYVGSMASFTAGLLKARGQLCGRKVGIGWPFFDDIKSQLARVGRRFRCERPERLVGQGPDRVDERQPRLVLPGQYHSPFDNRPILSPPINDYKNVLEALHKGPLFLPVFQCSENKGLDAGLGFDCSGKGI
jgi:hypothetical protein